MLLADHLTLDAPRRTADGYLAVRARAARTGVYDYRASEVEAPADRFDPSDTVKVYRDAAEVFAAEAVRSFIGRPITEDHPREAVTAANWREHARGTVMGALRDGDYLAFDLVLMDAAAIAAIEGGKRALSNGYQCQLDWTPGTAPDGTRYDARQSAIRGNHVALVEHGRAGDECGIPGSPASPDRRRGQVAGTGKDALFALCDANPAAVAAFSQETAVKTIVIDGLKLDLADAEAIAAAVARIEGELKHANDAKDALEAKAATLAQQLAEARLTPARLRDAAKAYQATLEAAKALGVTVADEMDEPAIVRTAVAAKLGDACKDWSDAQFAASFATLAASIESGEASRIVNIGMAKPVTDEATQRALHARAEMIAEMKGEKPAPGFPALAGAGKAA
jgi:hypothetical protein